MSKIVEVAAAVMLRADGREFLLAQRPEGKVYAGYWEFPGGKVEPGESVRQALIRELHEELGIAVQACSPWLVRQFTYPHATVRLHFWRVTAWSGEIGVTAPMEHSAVAWQVCGEAANVAPVLPANDPILKALALPCTMAITCAEEEGAERARQRLQHALQGGLRLVQIRDKTLSTVEREAFAKSVLALARAHGALVLVNDDAALAQRIAADGVHLSAAALAACDERPDFAWVGASCHQADDIRRAGALGLDYALLGSVLPTRTHPGLPGMGWAAFSENCSDNSLPVFALGGMTHELLPLAQEAGGHGIALMRAY